MMTVTPKCPCGPQCPEAEGRVVGMCLDTLQTGQHCWRLLHWSREWTDCVRYSRDAGSARNSERSRALGAGGCAASCWLGVSLASSPSSQHPWGPQGPGLCTCSNRHVATSGCDPCLLPQTHGWPRCPHLTSQGRPSCLHTHWPCAQSSHFPVHVDGG